MHACKRLDHGVRWQMTALPVAAAVGVCICVLLLLWLLAICWPACVYVILLMSLGTFSPTYAACLTGPPPMPLPCALS